jgi:hypothetical protein
MSDENVEALRQIIEAFRARDWDRIREIVDPNFEYHTSDQFPEGGETYRGPDAMMRVRAFLDEAWAEAEVELCEVIPQEMPCSRLYPVVCAWSGPGSPCPSTSSSRSGRSKTTARSARVPSITDLTR